MASLQEILSVSGSLKNAESIARQLSKKDPKFLLDLQLVLSAQGKISEAWEVSNQAFKLFPHDSRVLFNRGWLSISHGDLEEGLALLEKGRPAALWGDPPINTLKPAWHGHEDLSDQTVLILGEGGLGDQVFSIRFAKNLVHSFKGCKVIFACHNSLLSLFSRVKGISAIIDKQFLSKTPFDFSLAIHFDYWIPSFSLPLLLGLSQDSLNGRPYLQVSKASSCFPVISGKLKVGIRWSGNPQFEHDQFRRIPPELLFTLSEIPGIQLFSFQRDHDLVHLPENVIDLRPLLNSWEDTASALDNMDFLVSSCTSLAHVAGAIGKSTLLLTPIMPYYLWALFGNSTPWYDSVKLFRQDNFGAWDSVISKVKFFLSKRVQ